MSPPPLINFEIQKYYQNQPKFNDVYSRKNLSKIKDGGYIVNFDEFKSAENHMFTYMIPLYVNNINVTYINSFGVEHIPKEIKKCIVNKNIITNIYRIQA